MNNLLAAIAGHALACQDLATLQQVLREYRVKLADHRFCRQGQNPHVKQGKTFDNRCPTCVAADIALGVE